MIRTRLPVIIQTLIMLQLDKSILQNYDQAIQNEWLETNGLGGWSSSSVIGCNTRRYHGLLIAATVPPAERMALVSKLDETIIIDNEDLNWAPMIMVM